jgi:hypothetical protein
LLQDVRSRGRAPVEAKFSVPYQTGPGSRQNSVSFPEGETAGS